MIKTVRAIGKRSGMFILLLILAGCGRHEQAATTLGAASGAVIGAAVSGRHSRGTGALIGGLIGGMVVGEQGREADRQDAACQRAADRAMQQRKIDRLHEENRALREDMKRWCMRCHKKIDLVGARTCPSCGGTLIKEKVCRSCARTFNPQCGYRFCPYCDEGMLIGR